MNDRDASANPRPTGRLEATKDGRDLVLERTFRAGIEDVWASITESERTARWFASWTGEAGPGKTIRYRLEFEEGKPEADMRIDACEPPQHLAVRSIDEFGAWRLEAVLEHTDGIAMAIDGDGAFVHRITLPATATKQLSLSAPTVRASMQALEDAGVVRELSGKRRDRLFGYERYLDLMAGEDQPRPARPR